MRGFRPTSDGDEALELPKISRAERREANALAGEIVGRAP
jgi:hypothetical protein